MADLTTLTRVKLDLSISSTDTSNDTLLSSLISEASAVVENWCNRAFERQDYTESVGADGDCFLYVSNTPVNALTEVSYSGSTVSSTDYSLYESGSGSIFKDDGWIDTRVYRQEIVRWPVAENKQYQVIYNAGYYMPGSSLRDLPYDIERATLEMVKQLYQGRCREGALESEKIGSYSAKFRDMGIPPMTKTLLAPYVRPVVETP